jgi:hypothetical protein
MVLSALFIRRQRVHPIGNRHPKLTLMAVIVAFATLLTSLADVATPVVPIMPCGVFWWIVGTCSNWTCVLLLHRCQLLLWQLRITQDSLTAEHLQKWQPGWYTQRRHWMHRRMWTKVWICFLLLQTVVIPATAPLSDWPHACSPTTTTFVRAYLAITLAIGFIIGLALLILAIALHGEDDDALGLLPEIRLLSAVVIATSVVIAILVGSHGDHDRWLQNAVSWLLIGSSSMLCLTSLCWPLYLSYCWEKQVKQVGSIKQLASLLDIPGAFQAFLAFTAKEFTSENLVMLPTILCVVL